jgi:hypothetical protein
MEAQLLRAAPFFISGFSVKGDFGMVAGMLKDISNGGGQASNLWCEELVPKRKALGESEMKKAMRLAKGIPSDPDAALLWMAQIVCGLQDNREPQFSRDRQRLVVFRLKADAAHRAKQETNEFWSGKVRPVKIA